MVGEYLDYFYSNSTVTASMIYNFFDKLSSGARLLKARFLMQPSVSYDQNISTHAVVSTFLRAATRGPRSARRGAQSL